MFSRLIIEQKIEDLELALSRQEELIITQRQALNSLKELIYTEIARNESSSSHHTRPLTRPSHQITLNSNGGIIPKSHSSSRGTREPGAGIASADYDESSDSGSRKRQRHDTNPLRKLEQQQNNMSRSSPVVFNNQSLPSSKPAVPSIPKTALPRRRRALDKVKILLLRLPPVFPPATIASSAKPSNSNKSHHHSTIPSSDPENRDNTSMSSNKSDEQTPDGVSHAEAVPTTQAKASFTPSSTYINIDEVKALKKEDDKISLVRSWIEKLNENQVEEVSEFLSGGGKEVLVLWLNEINTDEFSPRRETNQYLEDLLNLLSKIDWTPDDIYELRLDKVLRKLYKKLFQTKSVIDSDVLQRIKTLWTQYRTMYNITKEIDDN